jgi:RNA polymerase sigma-70 factor (ECF subfamily)
MTIEPARRHTDGPPDDEVIALVLNGDVDQFAHLMARYQAALYRHAVAMVLDHDVAADMVQDAFIRGYRHLHTCRDRTRFRAWITQTLRRRCLDYLKDPRRQVVPLEAAGDVLDPREGPGDLAERRAVRGDIRRALAHLPGEQREAFLLHYVDGMPYDAMADLLAVSVSALKMRAMRARETLCSLLRSAVTTDATASSVYQVDAARHEGLTTVEDS